MLIGDHAPWFRARALSGSPTYAFDTVAGRRALMLFYGSARSARSAAALRLVQTHRRLFDDIRHCFFGVTNDPDDAAAGRIAQQLPGIRHFLDYDNAVAAQFGIAADEGVRPCWIVLDRALRIVGTFAAHQGQDAIACLAAPDDAADMGWAPVITVRDVLEPAMCRRLIALYDADGGRESGFMRDVEGKTTLILDARHKRRKDAHIANVALQRAILARINRRLTPALKRAFQFEATRIERHIVACYEAGAGHFRPHRDNTTRGTAHRKFAVTINLNAEAYDGGDLRFPEFGDRTYRAPTGGAVVFSCSLLHEATPVTRGRRYAYLPFLYDEASARVRERNNMHLAEGVSAYRSAALAG